jgi:hypothetical protein
MCCKTLRGAAREQQSNRDSESLNQYCALALSLESILRLPTLKIVLQHIPSDSRHFDVQLRSRVTGSKISAVSIPRPAARVRDHAAAIGPVYEGMSGRESAWLSMAVRHLAAVRRSRGCVELHSAWHNVPAVISLNTTGHSGNHRACYHHSHCRRPLRALPRTPAPLPSSGRSVTPARIKVSRMA